MSIGQGSVTVAQKKEPAGGGMPAPPFASNSADNGLSVDAVSGRIVLGNDNADAAAPAQLLSGRQILTNGNVITLGDFAALFTQLRDSGITAFDAVANNSLDVGVQTGQPEISLVSSSGSDASVHFVSNAADFLMSVASNETFKVMDSSGNGFQLDSANVLFALVGVALMLQDVSAASGPGAVLVRNTATMQVEELAGVTTSVNVGLVTLNIVSGLIVSIT